MTRKPSPAAPKPSDRVVIFGEVLCDLFAPEPGLPLAETPHLIPRLGGAPANVAVQLARLGVPTSIITATGHDPFGARLRLGLAHEGVDVSAVAIRNDRRTGVTLVEVDHDGERRFFGFRENSADLSLDDADLERPAARRLLRAARIVHTGTVSLRSPSSRRATRALQTAARARGTLVSLDVNLRPGMFPSLPLLLKLASAAVARADVVKATREEAVALLGKKASDEALVVDLLSRGPRLVMLTFGEEGALIANRQAAVRLLPLRRERAVDVTGAGDAFVGGALSWLFRRGFGGPGVDRKSLDALVAADLGRLGFEAGLCGAAVVTSLGATTGMLTGHGLAARIAEVGR